MATGMVMARERGATGTSGHLGMPAIRETLDLLLRTFPIRTCSDNKFAEHQRLETMSVVSH